VKTVIKKILFAFFWIAFVLFMFVVPAAAINAWVEEPLVRFWLLFLSFAVSLGLWSWISKFLIAAASQIYGFDKLEFGRFELQIRTIDKEKGLSRITAVLFLCISALSLVYCFAILYGLIAVIDSGAFNVGNVSLVSAVYFSFLVMSNSLAGDILPVSDLARFLVVVEMVLGAFYAVFFFSFVATFIRDNDLRN